MKPRTRYLSLIKQALNAIAEVWPADTGRVKSVISVISPPVALAAADTLQDKVDQALAGSSPPANWPEQNAAFWADHPRRPVSYAAALAALERQHADIARARDAHSDDDDDSDRLDYLRGARGQHDRETIWRGGPGAALAPGGFRPGWGPGEMPDGVPPEESELLP
jgi:hypothetical protein